MTKLSFEVPIKHIWEFHQHQDYIFSLSFLCKDFYYKRYITHCVNYKPEVILDNSFNELQEPEDPCFLAGLALGLGIEQVICPDSDEWDLIALANTYYQLVKHHPKEGITMVVRNPKEVEFFKDVGVQKFAIPYEYRPHAKKSYAKEGFSYACNLEEMHFLGLNSINELTYFRPKSCDTSMPIKLALKGMDLKDWKEAGSPHWHTKDMPKFFDEKLTVKQLNLAIDNIKVLKEAIHER